MNFLELTWHGVIMRFVLLTVVFLSLNRCTHADIFARGWIDVSVNRSQEYFQVDSTHGYYYGGYPNTIQVDPLDVTIHSNKEITLNQPLDIYLLVHRPELWWGEGWFDDNSDAYSFEFSTEDFEVTSSVKPGELTLNLETKDPLLVDTHWVYGVFDFTDESDDVEIEYSNFPLQVTFPGLTITTAPVPEPSAVLFLAIAGAITWLRRS